MTETQSKLIEQAIDWGEPKEAWGIWDTAKECWVRGQRDFFYNGQREAKAGLSQRMVHSTLGTWEWREIKGEIRDKMVKEFRRQVKRRYIVKQLF